MRLLLLLFLLSFLSCQSHEKKDKTVNNTVTTATNDLSVKFERQKQFLQQRKISSLSKVLDKASTKKCVILLYNETDCDDCIQKGFDIIKNLDAIPVDRAYIITSTPNPGRHQLLFDYPKLIFVDSHDLIRKELKFVHTPVLLVLNEQNQIQQNILFPGVATPWEEREFINYCRDFMGVKQKATY